MPGQEDARPGGCRGCSQHVPAQMPRTCRSFTALKTPTQEVMLVLLPSTPPQATFLLSHHGVPVALSQPGEIPAGALLSGVSCPVPSSVPGWSQPLHVASQQDNDLVTVLLLRALVPRGLPRAAFPEPRTDTLPGGTDRHTPVCVNTVTSQPLGQPRSCPALSCSSASSSHAGGSEGIDKQTFPSGG